MAWVAEWGLAEKKKKFNKKSKTAQFRAAILTFFCRTGDKPKSAPLHYVCIMSECVCINNVISWNIHNSSPHHGVVRIVYLMVKGCFLIHIHTHKRGVGMGPTCLQRGLE